MLEKRVCPLVIPRMQEEQCIFHPVAEHLTSSLLSSRYLRGHGTAHPLYMCFVHLEKAFDHVPKCFLWKVLLEYGVSSIPIGQHSQQ